MKTKLKLFAIGGFCVFPALCQTSLNLSHDLVTLGIASSNMVSNQPSLDSGPLLFQGVEYAKQHQIPLVIADPGTYYVSSLQNPNWHVQLVGINNMTIDLQGSNFIFSNPLTTAFYLGYNTNATFQNFSVDYQPLPFTQVSVVAVDANNAQIQYSVPPGWQDPNSFNTAPAGTIVEVHIFRNGQPAFGTRRMAASLPVSNNRISIVPYDTNPTPQNMSQIRPGDIAVVARRTNTVSISADRCVQCTIRNVRIYSSANAAIDTHFSTSSVLERIYMIPKPGTDRLVSAFGINSQNPGPNSAVRLSRAIRSMDDGFGLFNWSAGQVQTQNSSQSLTVVGKTNTTLDWLVSLPNGVPVTFQSPVNGSIVASAVIVSQVAAATTDRPYTVTYNFDRSLPASVVGSFMYSTDANLRGANSVIERNLVLSGASCCGGIDIGGWASNSVVRGNYVRRSAFSAIEGYQELEDNDGEPKSTPLVNVSISNNVVDGADLSPVQNLWWLGLGAIQMITLRTIPLCCVDLMTASPHQNITISDNFIADPGRSAVWVGNTSTGSVSSNYFWNPNNAPDVADMVPAHQNDATLAVTVDPTSNGITTSSNTIDTTSQRVFVTDTAYGELAAYAPGSTIRLSAYGIGQLNSWSINLKDADGITRTVPIQSTATHSLDVQIPSAAALGGAVLTLNSGSKQYMGTLFVDSQDNVAALNGCTYQVGMSSSSAPAMAVSVPILVVTQNGCTYNATTAATFAHPGNAGPGSGVISLALDANSGPARTANFEIAGQPLQVIQAAYVSPCDLNLDGAVSSLDLQAIISQALGQTTATADLNGDHAVNVLDIQIVINGAMGSACPAG